MFERFSLSAVVLVASGVAVAGCEDNPDQFYKQAPPGAGNYWNNGGSTPVYDPNAKNGLGDTFNTTSADQLCAGPVKHSRWAGMVQSKILPISQFGGVDLRGGENWPGLTFHNAQTVLCQATPDATQADHLVAHWGDNSEVVAKYLISNNVIDEIDLNPGFEGTLEFDSRSDEDSQKKFGHKNTFGAGHHYVVKIGQTLKKDNQDFILEWGNRPKLQAWATELYDALMWTYAPDLPSTQDVGGGKDCKSTQLCRAIGNNGDGTAGFGARPLGVYFQVPTGTQQPLASQPNLIYAFPVKIMPFSISTMKLKLDREGPTAVSTTNQVNCSQKLGQLYSDFIKGCVNVSADDAANKKNVTKLLGGLAHTKEVFNFSVQGVDTDFASSIIGPDKVILDDWTPSNTDPVYHWNIDIRAKGPLVNDLDSTLQHVTLAGTGAILREYQLKTQEDIVSLMTDWRSRHGGQTFKAHKIGDPACMMVTGNSDPTKNDNPLAWGPGKRGSNGLGGPEADCTGFEQLVTPGDPTIPDNAATGIDGNLKRMSLGSLAPNLGYVTLLAPGDPTATFCTDPPPAGPLKNTLESCQHDSDCNAGPGSCSIPDGQTTGVCDPTGTYFQHCGQGLDPSGNERTGLSDVILTASYNQVLRYLTTNDANELPPQLRDPKFYFQELGHAMVSYLLAAGITPPVADLRALGPTACDGKSCVPDPDHLQFDQVGNSADAAIIRYTDRRFVDEGIQPTQFEYQTSIASGNQTETRFRRYLERDETAVLKAMLTPTQPPSALASEQDNIRLTNIVGNSLVAGMFSGVKNDPVRTAWYCASHLDSSGQPDPACPQPPPRDSQKNDWARDDAGNPLLTNYPGIFGETAFSIGTNHLKLAQPLEDIRSAKVAVPLFSNPYVPDGTGGSAAGPQVVTVLPDWRPPAPGSGFAIPINGERQRFYPSAQVDFSGQSVSLAINYDLQADNSMQIMSVESQAFEGEVFLCKDPATNDILHIRQYDSIEEILDWLSSHAGAQDACQIIIGYNASNLSPVNVTSKIAGVEVFVGQGVGIGRIVDVMVFDPSLSQ